MSFLYIKGVKYKLDLISAEGYENAGVGHLIMKKPGKLWVSIKDVGDGLGVKNTSDLVWKEIQGHYGEKKFNKRWN